jgi:integrase
VKVKDVIREYRASPAYRSLADTSKRQYTSSLSRLETEFGEKKITEVKRSDIIRLTNKMGNTPAMANRVARVTSVLFSFALDMGVIDHSPAVRLKKQKIGTLAKWEPEEVFRVIALKHPVVSPAVALGWFTGQRESDILSAQWTDITDNGTILQVIQQKTGMVMEIELHPALQKYLKKIRKKSDSPYIVGKKMSSSAFRAMFKQAIEKIGIHKTFHGIRKGVASYLAEVEVTASGIQRLLGHKSLSMATLYTNQAAAKKLIKYAVKSIPAPEEMD